MFAFLAALAAGDLSAGPTRHPLAAFDDSCPAMAQGTNRLERGRALGRYVSQRYGFQHKVVVVPLCGHNPGCMYRAEVTPPILFPSPRRDTRRPLRVSRPPRPPCDLSWRKQMTFEFVRQTLEALRDSR